MKNFPELFKKASTGKIQTWSISVDGADITVKHGQVGGAIQVATETIKAGKNQGRANETSAESQALAEAEAKWTKQLKKGYCKTLAEAESGAVDEIVAGGVNPMLAQKYRDHASKIKFPCFGQAKLDGMRCIAIIEPSGKVTLWSRTRKPVNSVPHIVKELSRLACNKTVTLDGELYGHHYKKDFEKIISLARQEVPAPGHEAIQYWVYDTVSDEDFKNRTLTVSNLLSEADPNIIVIVPTYKLDNAEQLDEYFAKFMEDGYEGLMARNALGGYENKRSYNLQKVKEMQDAEFLITGVESGRGKREGQAVLVLQNEAGQTFRASPKGNDAFRIRLLKDAKGVIGKMATIQFQNLTNLGVPRFGVAKCVRDYE